MDRFDRAVAEDQQASVVYTEEQSSEINAISQVMEKLRQSFDLLAPLDKWGEESDSVYCLIIEMGQRLNRLKEYPNG